MPADPKKTQPTSEGTASGADRNVVETPAEDERKPIKFAREPGGNDEDDDLDMTPMVDVTFLLLIFFMITAAFALQKAIEVPPQSEDQAASTQTVEELEEDSITVRINGDNVYWVGCPAWGEERRAPSKQDMRTAVREARNGGNANSPGFAKLLVQASSDATHEFVVAALDAGSANSVEQIQLMMIEDEDYE